MRGLVMAAVAAFCGMAYGQDKQQWFELPFSDEPPLAVKKTMDDAEREISKQMRRVFENTESSLKNELKRLQENRRLDEANFTQATLDIFKTWLVRNEFYHHVPSPVGAWRWKTPATTQAQRDVLTWHANGTGKASWHSQSIIWTQDSFGIVRSIYAGGHRNIHEWEFRKLNNGEWDGGTLYSKTDARAHLLRLPGP